MVRISDAASELLVENLANGSVPSETGYRLASVGDGYKLRLDHPSSDDRVIRQMDRVVLMVEPQIDDELEGVVLDVGNEEAKRLVLKTAS